MDDRAPYQAPTHGGLPVIELVTEHMWCRRHFEANRGEGAPFYTRALLWLFAHLSADPRFIALCTPPGGAEARADWAAPALAAIAATGTHACCWLPYPVFQDAMNRARAGEWPGREATEGELHG